MSSSLRLSPPLLCRATHAFEAGAATEVSFPAGALLQVTHVGRAGDWAKGAVFNEAAAAAAAAGDANTGSIADALRGTPSGAPLPAAAAAAGSVDGAGGELWGAPGWFAIGFVDLDAAAVLAAEGAPEAAEAGEKEGEGEAAAAAPSAPSAAAVPDESAVAGGEEKGAATALSSDDDGDDDDDGAAPAAEDNKPQRPPLPTKKPSLAATTSSAPTAAAAAGARTTNVSGREHVAKELVSTEHTYLKALITATNVYLVPLRTAGIVDGDTLVEVFANLEALVGINTSLFAQLEARVQAWQPATSRIGDIMLQHVAPSAAERERHAAAAAGGGGGGGGSAQQPPLQSEFMRAYQEYMAAHARSIVVVNQLTSRNKGFAQFLADTRVKHEAELQGLDLLAFLITPVQRVLRYRLLLQDLLKQTGPEHPDAEDLTEALKWVEQLAEDGNSAIAEQDNLAKLAAIEDAFVGKSLSTRTRTEPMMIPGRRFLREGPMMKVSRKRDQRRWFFLMSDVLVYAKVVSTVDRATKSLERSVTSRMSVFGVKAGAAEAAAEAEELTSSTRTGVGFESAKTKNRFVFSRAVPLTTARLAAAPTPASVSDPVPRFYINVLTRDEKSFTCYVRSEKERQVWLDDFARTREEALADESDDEDTAGGGDGTGGDGAAPVWVQDKDVRVCPVCEQVRFSYTVRRHHCRQCGGVVCGGCSSFKLRLAHSRDKAVRVCAPCFASATGQNSAASSAAASPALPSRAGRGRAGAAGSGGSGGGGSTSSLNLLAAAAVGGLGLGAASGSGGSGGTTTPEPDQAPPAATKAPPAEDASVSAADAGRPDAKDLAQGQGAATGAAGAGPAAIPAEEDVEDALAALRGEVATLRAELVVERDARLAAEAALAERITAEVLRRIAEAKAQEN